MKTAEKILTKYIGVDDPSTYSKGDILLAMEEYAIEYHRLKLCENTENYTEKDLKYAYNTGTRNGIMQEAGLEADYGFQMYLQHLKQDKITNKP